MPLYHPRILAQKLEDLVLTLLHWSHSATQLRQSALVYQSKMESQLAGESRTAGILAAHLVAEKQELAQVDAMLAVQTAYYCELKTEVDQVCVAVQQAYKETQQVLAHWQAELVKAEQWMASATAAFQRAEKAWHSVCQAVEQASEADRSYAHAAEAQLSVARKERNRAEREVSEAQERANRCTNAVNSACEAVRVAEEAQRYSQQGANASGRSYEHIVAAQKACEGSQEALRREEEAMRAADEALESARTTLDDAAASLQAGLRHEQSSQAYQAQARVELDGKIQALLALNQPDYSFSNGGAIGDPVSANGASIEGGKGSEGKSISFLIDGTRDVLEKEYAGPKSDLELQPLIERLSQKRELITSEWWSKLKEEKRVEVLRRVHREMARAYGFPPCQVEAYKLRPKLYGMFSEDHNLIVINRSVLAQDHPRQALSTLAHESRHAYQYHAIKQYTWTIPVQRRYVVKLWKANWQNYETANENYESYYKQPVEADARAFSEEVVRQMYGGK